MANSIIAMKNEIKSVQYTGTTNSTGRIEGGQNIFGAPAGAVLLGAVFQRGDYGTRRRVDTYAYGNAGWGFIFYNSADTSTIVESAEVTCTIYYI
jgi:hypothetical protein